MEPGLGLGQWSQDWGYGSGVRVGARAVESGGLGQWSQDWF